MAASVVVKQEPVEFVDFEAKVLELCKENPKGITDTIIQDNLPNITPQQRVKGINRLLSTVRIGTFSFSFGFLFFYTTCTKSVYVWYMPWGYIHTSTLY